MRIIKYINLKYKYKKLQEKYNDLKQDFEFLMKDNKNLKSALRKNEKKKGMMTYQ